MTTEKGIRVGTNAETSRRCIVVKFQKPCLFQMVVLCCDNTLRIGGLLDGFANGMILPVPQENAVLHSEPLQHA